MTVDTIQGWRSWSWTKRDYWCLGIYGVVAFTLNLLAQQHPFFWDGIQLGAKHALWYYEQDFQFFFLPEEIDSGHPPFFGQFLALGWTLFGKSLWTSHWLMFPFFLGAIFYAFCIGKSTLRHHWRYLFPALLYLDPAFLSQALLVGPDLVLIFFFLMTFWAFLKEHKWLKLLGVLGLGLISMRGMMLAFCFFLLETIPLYKSFLARPGVLFRHCWPYAPGVLAAGLFLWLHYQHTGWIGYHADSPWAPSFAKVDLQGFLRNGIILIWRLLDFGHIFLFLGMLFLLYRQKSGVFKQQRSILLLLSLLLVVLAWPFLMYQGLSQHRYLLPFFVVLNLLFLRLLSAEEGKWVTLFILVTLGLFSGNRWIYPDSISQGWDSTLAHWPYYSMQKEVIDFLDAEEIPIMEVGAAFPAIGPLKYRYLNEEERGFKKKNIKLDRYLFYSNIMNEYSEEELSELKNWTILFEKEKKGVRVIIYVDAEIESERVE